jgi:hypothetical protein
MTEGQMDISQQDKMWADFTRIMTWSTIFCVAVLALMAAFIA